MQNLNSGLKIELSQLFEEKISIYFKCAIEISQQEYLIDLKENVPSKKQICPKSCKKYFGLKELTKHLKPSLLSIFEDLFSGKPLKECESLWCPRVEAKCNKCGFEDDHNIFFHSCIVKELVEVLGKELF